MIGVNRLNWSNERYCVLLAYHGWATQSPFIFGLQAPTDVYFSYIEVSGVTLYTKMAKISREVVGLLGSEHAVC